MKKTLALVFAFTLVLAFTGCSIFGGAVDYFPVKEGKIWTSLATTTVYDSTYNFVTQVWDITYDTTTATSTNECVGETTLDDGTKVWEFKTVQDTSTTYSYMAIGDEMVDYYVAKTDTAPVYSMPKKLAVGSTWEMAITDTTAIKYEATGNEDVTVPAGTFAGALKITVTFPEMPYMTFEGYQWWNKDEGAVKSYTKSTSSVPDMAYRVTETTTELQSSN